MTAIKDKNGKEITLGANIKVYLGDKIIDGVVGKIIPQKSKPIFIGGEVRGVSSHKAMIELQGSPLRVAPSVIEVV